MPKLLPGGNILFLDKVIMTPNTDWSRFDMNMHYQRAVLHVDAMVGRCKQFRGAIFLMDEKNINMNVVSTFLGSLGGFRKLMSCIQVRYGK